MTFIRIATDVTGIVISTASGIVSARLLGPVGKGDLAVLLVLSTVGIHLSATGIGEAAIVGVAKRRTTEIPAFSTAVLWALATGCVCGAVLSILALVVLGTPAAPTILILGTVPAGALVVTGNQFLLMRGRIGVIGIISVTSLAVTLAGYVVVASLDVPRLAGAGGAVLAGPLVAVASMFFLGLRTGLQPSRRMDLRFLRWAISYGFVAEFAYLIGTVSARGDTLLVFAIAGQRDAGLYSVALTVGAVMAAVPWALSYVSFPRLANAPASDAARAIGEVCRVGIIAAVVVAIPAAIAAPIAIPFAFGSAFSAASGPAVILIVGTVFVAAQVLLCRGIASRGSPRIMLVSYLATVVAMVASDCLLIPLIGLSGAALGSVFGALVGLAVVRRGARRWARREVLDPSVLRLVPGRSDARHFEVAIFSLWAKARLFMADRT